MKGELTDVALRQMDEMSRLGYLTAPDRVVDLIVEIWKLRGALAGVLPLAEAHLAHELKYDADPLNEWWPAHYEEEKSALDAARDLLPSKSGKNSNG